MEINAVLRQLADQYADAAQDILAENLTSVVLFGSVARGEAQLNSDIDLLLVCRELPVGVFRRQHVVEGIRARLQADLDRLWAEGCYSDFAEILKTEAEARESHLLYLDMTTDALLLFDRGGFFAQILAKMRARLKSLGAQQKRLGRIRYWDLKPDLKAGEVVIL